MRVCIVAGNIYPLLANRYDLKVIGGSEVQQYWIGKHLQAQEISVVYVGEDFGQGLDTETDGFHILSYRYGKLKIKQLISLWQALSRANADIYYVRGMPKWGILIYVFCRLNRRKIVQGLASNVEVQPEFASGLARQVQYRLHAMWRTRSDLIIAQTVFQSELLFRRWNTISQVVPNLMPVVSVPITVKHSSRFTILWVGSLAPHKRAELVIEIARLLPDLFFMIVGDISRGHERYSKSIRERLSSMSNLEYLGFVPYHKSQTCFREANVFLHTGGPIEGFPNVFLQAWAEGVPVVSMGANPDDIIEHEGLGLVAPTVERAVDVLRYLRLHEDEACQMGERARQYVARVHAPEVVIPRYIELFTRLVNRN